jgi:hypothetical protein
MKSQKHAIVPAVWRKPCCGVDRRHASVGSISVSGDASAQVGKRKHGRGATQIMTILIKKQV